MEKKLSVILVASLLFLSVLYAFTADHSSEQSRNSPLKNALSDFSKDEALNNSSWGFYAVDTRTGKTIISHNPDLALIPASTQKVVTTLTALSMLGSDYQFETLLQYDGNIEKGSLKGNLYIKGLGDPMLGAKMADDTLALDLIFAKWLREIKATGITTIEGNIIADGSWFDDQLIPPKWMWEDMGNYYGAGAHALSVHENLYSVFFQPGNREGTPATVANTDPAVPGMTFHNDVTTGPRGSGDKVYIYGSPYSNQRWLTGTVPLGENNFEVKGSLPDPGYFLAATFANFLQQNNIALKGSAYTHRNTPANENKDTRVIISRHQSPRLEVIAARTNFNSVNTYAENFIKTLGRVFKDEGTFSAGSEVITEFWEEKGLDTRGLRIHDGSGLSPYNNITVRQLTGMLVFAAQDEALYNSLIKGFPVAGRSGSLAGMFTGTSSQGVLSAKSGFLGNVRAYTGYTRSQEGHVIAFTIIVNNYSGTPIQMRRKMEKVMDALTGMKL